jgi:hypothetical protein
MGLDIVDSKRLCYDIEKIYAANRSNISYIEVISEYAEDNSILVEDIVGLLSPLLMDKIKYESNKLNLLKGEKINEIII